MKCDILLKQKGVSYKMSTLRIAIIFILVLSLAGFAYAQSSNFAKTSASGTKATSEALQHKPGMKAERGVKNILFGWTDIPRSIIQVTRDSKNPIWGLTAGTLKGIGKAVPRTVSGVADVVSFPIGDYDKMPVKPDEWDTQIQ